MVLKSLELQGFKSFPDKTKIDFNRGLTAVVGPNGSGKSNISDAVRWVMGEMSTKSLRGDKMEDVIFSGTKSRKAVGFAEVSLIVDNANREFAIDTDDVKITRKIYRSGDSEYMINGAQVRLKDINETFMDTGLGKDGYSIIGQGKIAEIVRSKSTERREIFEEAAGISKYRYRKNESERKLTQAEENLVRLRDILAELESRVAPLKEQSEKAKRFLELSDEKKLLEISIWMNTLDKANVSIKEQDDHLLIFQNQQEAVEAEIEKIENDIQHTYEKMQQCLVDIESLRAKKDQTELSIANTNSQIAVCENDIAHNESNVERLDGEILSFSQSNQDQKDQIAQKEQKIIDVNSEIKRIDEYLKNKQDELSKLSKENDSISQKVAQINSTINKHIIEQSESNMTIASTRISIAQYESEIEKNSIELDHKSDDVKMYFAELSDANELLISIDQKQESLKNSFSGYKMKLDNKTKDLNEKKSQYDTLQLKIKETQQNIKLLENLESSLEGYAYSVKEIIKRANNRVINGVHGTVSQIINVNKEYSVAVEIALGGSLQNIVVENESVAKNAIRLLKQDNLGRATFLPITSVNANKINADGLDRYAGYIDIASNLVEYDEKYKPVVDFLLGRIVIVDDIDTAVLIAQKNGYRFKIVTLDGQVINAGGSLTGGSRNKSQGLLSRKNDIKLLQTESEKLVINSEQMKNQLNELNQEVSQINAEVVALNSEMQTANEDKIRFAGEKKRLEQVINQTKELINSMKAELENKAQRLIDLRQQQSNSQTLLEQAKQGIAVANNELEKIQGSRDDVSHKQEELAQDLSSKKIRKIELSKDIESLIAEIESIKSRQIIASETLAKLEHQKIELTQNNESIKALIESYKVQQSQSRNEVEQINNQIDDTLKKRQQLESDTTVMRKKEREISDQKEKIVLQAVRHEEKKNSIQKEYDEIIAKLWEEYELTRSEATSYAQKIEDVPKSLTQLNSVKSKIRSLGSVNVSAIEEYQEVSGRYEYLLAQIQDVEKSKIELTRLISDLTQKMKQIFSESFVEINNNFSKIFIDLFGGGRAELKLTDPDNVLDSGIEIFVEPPGKIIKNLTLLSGGEQAFVAIAIYFAILKYRPSPFCMLDEIEAALDDVNVNKYASYLRQLTDNTQFILITHRRGTMEEADVLYGVTMQDEGVSKLLKLKVSELENKLGLDEVI